MINRYNLEEHLIEKQFSYVGKKLSDALNYRNWREEWTVTVEQRDNFGDYAIPLIKKVLKINKSKAEGVFNKFLLDYGLKLK